jgi:ribose transport system permease protein
VAQSAGHTTGTSEPAQASGRGPVVTRDWKTDLKYRVPGRYVAGWGALVLLIVVVAIATPAALGPGSLRSVSALAGVLALASFGQMLIVMLGAIDLSVPAIIGASAGIVVHYGVEGANLPLVFAGAIAVAVVISAVNGALISVLRLNPLIVTLATFGIVTGAILLWTGVSFSLTGQAPSSLRSFATWSVLNLNACFLVAVVVGIVLATVLNRTRSGRRVAAVGSNRRAARALGTRVTTVEISTFAAAGLLYGIAGVLLAGFVGTPNNTVGAPYQLATVTAIAIAGSILSGGPASAATVVIASFFLQLLDQTLIVAGLSAGVRVIVQGLALAIAVAAITLGQYGWSGLRQGSRLLGALARRS